MQLERFFAGGAGFLVIVLVRPQRDWGYSPSGFFDTRFERAPNQITDMAIIQPQKNSLNLHWNHNFVSSHKPWHKGWIVSRPYRRAENFPVF